jgi:hypothetical protein
MKNVNKFFLMSALLVAASSTSYAAMQLVLDNDRSENLIAHFQMPLADGRISEAVNANSKETVLVGDNWLKTDVVVTWKNLDGKEVDTDTVHFKLADETLQTSSDDDQNDGDVDELTHQHPTPTH